MGIKDVEFDEARERFFEWTGHSGFQLDAASSDDVELVKVISVADLRREIGKLRGGRQCRIVLYRGKPACLVVPHPIDYWERSAPFMGMIAAIRNSWLSEPYADPSHDWAEEQTEVQIGTMEDVRRGTAQVFGHLLRNSAYMLTYYDRYEVMTLLPVPADMEPVDLAAMSMIIQRVVRFPGAYDVLDLSQVDKYEKDVQS